jgi:hypothetical protein
LGSPANFNTETASTAAITEADAPFYQFWLFARREDLRRSSGSRVNRQRGTLAVRSAGDLDADVQILLHRLDVSDGAHHSSSGMQLVERSDGLL